MLFHVVLFRPRPDLTAADRASLAETLESALQRIPSIRRFHIGRRVVHGAGYEALMPVSLDYAAVVEFDDLAGLEAYLEHPAHQALGAGFMRSLEASAIYDYEMLDGEGLRRLVQAGSGT
jgi:hypothetical protein